MKKTAYTASILIILFASPILFSKQNQDVTDGICLDETKIADEGFAMRYLDFSNTLYLNQCFNGGLARSEIYEDLPSYDEVLPALATLNQNYGGTNLKGELVLTTAQELHYPDGRKLGPLSQGALNHALDNELGPSIEDLLKTSKPFIMSVDELWDPIRAEKNLLEDHEWETFQKDPAIEINQDQVQINFSAATKDAQRKILCAQLQKFAKANGLAYLIAYAQKTPPLDLSSAALKGTIYDGSDIEGAQAYGLSYMDKNGLRFVQVSFISDLYDKLSQLSLLKIASADTEVPEELTGLPPEQAKALALQKIMALSKRNAPEAEILPYLTFIGQPPANQTVRQRRRHFLNNVIGISGQLTKTDHKIKDLNTRYMSSWGGKDAQIRRLEDIQSGYEPGGDIVDPTLSQQERDAFLAQSLKTLRAEKKEIAHQHQSIVGKLQTHRSKLLNQAGILDFNVAGAENAGEAKFYQHLDRVWNSDQTDVSKITKVEQLLDLAIAQSEKDITKQIHAVSQLNRAKDFAVFGGSGAINEKGRDDYRQFREKIKKRWKNNNKVRAAVDVVESLHTHVEADGQVVKLSAELAAGVAIAATGPFAPIFAGVASTVFYAGDAALAEYDASQDLARAKTNARLGVTDFQTVEEFESAKNEANMAILTNLAFAPLDFIGAGKAARAARLKGAVNTKTLVRETLSHEPEVARAVRKTRKPNTTKAPVKKTAQSAIDPIATRRQALETKATQTKPNLRDIPEVEQMNQQHSQMDGLFQKLDDAPGKQKKAVREKILSLNSKMNEQRAQTIKSLKKVLPEVDGEITQLKGMIDDLNRLRGSGVDKIARREELKRVRALLKEARSRKKDMRNGLKDLKRQHEVDGYWEQAREYRRNNRGIQEVTSRGKKMDRNLAIVSTNIDGLPPTEMTLMSGRELTAGTSSPFNELKRKFRTFEKTHHHGGDRSWDTESQFVEDLYKQAKKHNKNLNTLKGNVKLFSEMPLCASCTRLLKHEFGQVFPNVSLDVYEGDRRMRGLLLDAENLR